MLVGFTTYAGSVTAASRWDGAAERKRVRPALDLLAQVPLILLMVGYTFTGLWVLGQVLAAP